MGWSFIETTGAAAATLELFDGSSTGGATIAVRVSLFLNVISGSIRGAVWVVPAERLEPYEALQGVVPWFAQQD